MQNPTENSEPQRIGILTGGGTGPGWNAVIHGATKTLTERGHTVIGIPEGWKGLLKPSKNIVELSNWNRRQMRDLLRSGGSVLGSSRDKVKKDQHDQVRNVARNEYRLNGAIFIGGDDTLGQANEFDEADILPAVGIPKTIDNDVHGTDKTFGFETAVQQVVEQLEAMQTDAETMHRVAVVEIQGREAGWIALHAGAVAGADITLIREFPISMEKLMNRIREIFLEQGHVVIAVAEGYEYPGKGQNVKIDPFGNKRQAGVGGYLAGYVKKNTGLDTEEQVSGYVPRGVRPLAQDAIFCNELGAAGGLFAHQKKYGTLVALRDGKITGVPLEEAKGGRNVTADHYDVENMRKHELPPNMVSMLRETTKE